MKKIIFVLIIFIYFADMPSSVYAQMIDESIKNGLYTESGASSIDAEIKKYWNEDIQKIYGSNIPGDSVIPKNIVKGLPDIFLREIKNHAGSCVTIVIISLLWAIFKALQPSPEISDIAVICFITGISVLLITGFIDIYKLTKTTIDAMMSLMYTAIPVLGALSAKIGGETFNTMLRPVLILVVEVCATLIYTFFLPVSCIFIVSSFAGIFGAKGELVKNICSVLKKVSMWALGVMMVCFISYLLVQQTIAKSIGDVASKTIKYAVSNSVPVSGKYIADAADTVFSMAAVIKNTAGGATLTGVIIICIVPILKIAAIQVVLRFSGYVTEALGDKKLADPIRDISECYGYLLSLLMIISIFFIIVVASITSYVGNANL